MVSSPRSRFGVSVLELVIVVAVLGILLSIGVVQLRQPAARLLANDLKGVIEQARFEAIKRNRPVAVLWDVDGGRVESRFDSASALVAASCDGDTRIVSRELSEYRGVQVDVAMPGDTFNRGVVWLPTGQGRTCHGTPDIRTEIRVSDGRGERLILVSVGGRVSVQ